MPLITPVGNSEKVAKADSGGERPFYPEDFSLATGEKTIPIATNHLEKITIIAEGTGAGDADIYMRANDTADWFLLASISLAADGSQSEQLDCPSGQLYVENNGLTTLTVYVMGMKSRT